MATAAVGPAATSCALKGCSDAGPVVSESSTGSGQSRASSGPEAAATKQGQPQRRGGAFRHGGTVPTAVCLSKAAIGAAVLSVAAHCAEVGLLFQLLGLAVGLLLTVASIRMIAGASVETGCWSYEDICEELFHPAVSLFTGFVQVCHCLGGGAGYLIVCGQIFQVVSGASEASRRLVVVLVGVFVCGPLALARHVGFMRHLAAASVVALLLLVVAVAWYLAQHGPDETVTTESLWLGPGGTSIFTYMNSINNIVCAYTNQFNVPQLTGELTPQPSVRKMTVISLITTVLCFLLYGGVSLLGVLAFGIGENQKDSLVLDLTPERRQPLVLLSLVAVMFSVLTCFQFHVYPIRQFAAYAIRKARGRSTEHEKADVAYGGRTLTRWLDIASALSAVLVIILIAVVVTSLKTILDFVGAFAAAYISYIVPPLWVIQVRRRQKGFSWWGTEILLCLALFALGLFFFFFGTYSAIRSAIEG